MRGNMNPDHTGGDRASRRGFLRASAATLSAAAIGGTLQAFLGRVAAAEGYQPLMEGYGPLRPVADDTTGLKLLQLTDGFHYH